MALISKSRLEGLAGARSGTKTFSEILLESQRESRSAADVAIFLSHSHSDLDKPGVRHAIVLLRRLGLRVYIDSEDSSLPVFTNAETANGIKRAIRNCNKFILLATNNAISSKWCNWELGFGDAHKYINHIALFPLTENNGNWTGSEYLAIYPRIEADFLDRLNVIYPDGKEVPLVDWLSIK